MTLEDIADKCGVSVSTVSRALNNDPRISRKTVQRVHNVAAQHNFTLTKRKRPLSRSMVTLLVVIPDSSETELNPFFDMGELINAINSAFADEKTKIETMTFSQLGKLESIKDIRCSGIICAFGSIDDKRKQILKDNNIPYIFLNRTFEDENYVSCNNFKGVVRLVEYLWAKGFRRIGYLGCNSIPVNKDRFRGYMVASFETNGSLNNDLILNVDSIQDVDDRSAGFFVDKKCDAIICFNDNFSIRMITALQDLGIKIPEDISVTGFDSSPMRKVFKPLITTISLSTFEMGFFAARWLRDNIQHKEIRQLRLEVDGKLLEGDTVA
ncbi:MAG: LacI family transcriptional regulator [Desulfobacterales bacterium]|nr:LacI family transcriptional regulator [Desulfobacterales bacterium]